ncbi:MAG: hypothetical protein ACK6CU_24565 [Deltaproteobacteria bacterium]
MVRGRGTSDASLFKKVLALIESHVVPSFQGDALLTAAQRSAYTGSARRRSMCSPFSGQV